MTVLSGVCVACVRRAVRVRTPRSTALSTAVFSSSLLSFLFLPFSSPFFFVFSALSALWGGCAAR